MKPSTTACIIVYGKEKPILVMNHSADIQRVVASLVMGHPQEKGMCGCWNTVHRQAVCSEGLGPWIYKSLTDAPEAGLNQSLLAAFRHDYRSSAISCLYREAALRTVLTAFAENEIQVIILKGCYLGHFVYEEPPLRPMIDVDLLVREEQFHNAGRVLECLGYRPMFRLSPYEDQCAMLPIVYKTLSTVPDLVDLHRSIRSMDYYTIPADLIWEDAVEMELGACKVFCLSPELNFIHLALHLFNHPNSLRDWVDLLTVLRTTNVDWDRLLRLARSAGVVRPLFWTFRELELNWGLKVPVSFSESLESYAPDWWEDRVIGHRCRYLWRLAARIGRMNGWRERIRYIGSKCLPPRDGGAGRTASSYISHVTSKFGYFMQLWRRS